MIYLRYDICSADDIRFAYEENGYYIILALSKYIMRQSRISYCESNISLKNATFNDKIYSKEGAFMSENKLLDMSFEFAAAIVNLVDGVTAPKSSYMTDQLARAGTSVGANIHEAQYAQGKKDFISKLEIALKEASETGYWLELLYRTKYIDEPSFKSLSSKCSSLRVMLISSCKTAKQNLDK